MRDFFLACPPENGACTREVGTALALRWPAAPDAIEVNRILGLGTIEELDELASLYEGARFWVSLDPTAALDDALLARGFVPAHAWQKFERGVEPVVARTDLRVVDALSRRDFGATFAPGYGVAAALGSWAGRLVSRPAWHCFVAYDGRAPVAAGALFALREAGWLGFAATLASHRGRGAQGAILPARVAQACELGLGVLITETGVPREGGTGQSYRNVLRSGFRPTYVRPNYASAS